MAERLSAEQCAQLHQQVIDSHTFNTQLYPHLNGNVNAYLDTLRHDESKSDVQRIQTLINNSEELRQSWFLHYKYLAKCAAQMKDTRTQYVTPRSGSLIPLHVDNHSLHEVYGYLIKCFRYILELNEPRAIQAQEQYEHLKTKPDGHDFQLRMAKALQERFDQKYEEYNACTDATQKEALRRQLVTIQPRLTEKQQALDTVRQQMKRLRMDITTQQVTQKELNRIGEEYANACRYFDMELFDLDIHAI